MKLRLSYVTQWLLACAISCALPAKAATYYVGSIANLTTRINSAVAGDEIILSNGVYTTSSAITVTRVGSAANRILIRAETVGGAEIGGTSGFAFNSGAAYVTVQGFKFTHSGSINISSSASNIRFTRNIVQLAIPSTNDVSYFNISANDVEIDRNELRNKSTLGNMLDITGSGSQVARRLWVHHNYFHDFTSPGGNGAETVRWGLSGLSLSTGDGLCEYNLFVRCNGENEMISNKSSGNTYRYNTVLDCPGGEMSQRHGNDCLYYGNYMRNSAGIRVYGDRHKIFNNYLEGNSMGVNMGNGDGDVYNGAALTAHDRPDDNFIMFNTFINNSTHYQMGGRTGGLGSSNTVVANNVFQGGGSIGTISSSAPYTGTWTNNIRWNTSSTGNMPASGYSTVNPLLAADGNGILHIQSGSPAINAGRAAFDYYGAAVSYSNIVADMDGQSRDANRDVGADEFSAAPVSARILTTNDVGPWSGVSAPAQPTGASATPGNQTVLVSWNPASQAETYKVKRAAVSGGPYTTIASNLVGISYADTGLVNGVTYYYVISAANTVGESANSPEVSAAPTALAPTGLVARLTFDDDTANDSSGYSNHGTLMNGAAIVTDPQRGKVVSLDGANDFVDLGNGASLNLSDNNQATIAAWVKLAVSQNHNTILSKGEWKEAYALVVKGDTTPDDQLWTGNDTGVFSGSSVPLNTWTHVAMTINGSLTTFYINGAVAGGANQNRGAAIDNTATGICLGREQYSGSMPAGRWLFNGQMDDVRIYERALTQPEIQSAMVGTPPQTRPRIVRYDCHQTGLVFGGTNGTPSGTYYVLSSTDIGLPVTSWPRIATNAFDSSGDFVFTNAAPADPQRFYALQLP